MQPTARMREVRAVMPGLRAVMPGPERGVRGRYLSRRPRAVVRDTHPVTSMTTGARRSRWMLAVQQPARLAPVMIVMNWSRSRRVLAIGHPTRLAPVMIVMIWSRSRRVLAIGHPTRLAPVMIVRNRTRSGRMLAVEQPARLAPLILVRARCRSEGVLVVDRSIRQVPVQTVGHRAHRTVLVARRPPRPVTMMVVETRRPGTRIPVLKPAIHLAWGQLRGHVVEARVRERRCAPPRLREARTLIQGLTIGRVRPGHERGSAARLPNEHRRAVVLRRRDIIVRLPIRHPRVIGAERREVPDRDGIPRIPRGRWLQWEPRRPRTQHRRIHRVLTRSPSTRTQGIRPVVVAGAVSLGGQALILLARPPAIGTPSPSGGAPRAGRGRAWRVGIARGVGRGRRVALGLERRPVEGRGSPVGLTVELMQVVLHVSPIAPGVDQIAIARPSPGIGAPSAGGSRASGR